MPKTLEEIQAEFTKSMAIEEQLIRPGKTKGPKTKAVNTIEKKEKSLSSSKKSRAMAVVSDIIFAIALVMMGACAILLSYGEGRAYTDKIYRIVDDNYAIVLITFAVLVIFSFFLRIFAQKKEENGEKTKERNEDQEDND